MRRMLDPKEVGGGSLPSTITFDENGNRKVGKDLGVDGKLKLKSLVSASNPDGDITKELGSGGASNITISYVPKSKKAFIDPGTYSSNNPIKLNFDSYPWLDANILPPSVITTTATCKDNTGATITLIVYLYKYNNYKLGLTLIPTKEFTVDSTVSTDYAIQWEELHITIA